MNNDNFLIEESDLEQARSIVKTIANPNLRNRAVANALAADLTSKYFVDVEVDTESGLYHIAQILEELEISDVYIRENYIDVRFYFNEDGLYVPKSHFDRNLLPIAYMFIKLEEDLAGGLVAGFIPASSIDTSNETNGYYRVKEDDLVSFYDIESMIVQDNDVEIPDTFETELFDFLDNKLEGRDSFYRLLLVSSEARMRLIDAAKAKVIFQSLSLEPIADVNENDSDDAQSEDIVSSEELPELSLETSENLMLEEEGAEELSLVDDLESFELEEAEEIVDNNIEELTLSTDDTSEDFDGGLELAADVKDEPLLEFGSDDLIPSDDVSLDGVDSGLELVESDSLLEDNTIDLVDSVDTDLPTFDVDETLEEHPVEISIDGNSELIKDIDEVDSIELAIPDSDSISMLGVGDEEPLLEAPSIESNDIGLESTENEDTESTDFASIVDLDDFVESNDDTINIIEDLSVDSTKAIETTANMNSDNVNPLEIVEDEAVVIDEFNFSTATTPSLDTSDNEIVDIDDLETMLEKDVPSYDSNLQPEKPEGTEQIDDLFGREDVQLEEETYSVPQKKGSPLIPLLGLVLLGVGGYFGYTKYFAQPVDSINNNILPAKTVDVINKTPAKEQDKKATVKKETPVAMPVETVENLKTINNTNEGNAVSIPAIETNLDASVLVSNLSVNWEVPASYVSNTTAKRYFTKIGKIIQLNLKTELLLLSNPPITNKITLELEFNNDASKFVVKSILESSGEKTVDEIIKTTVAKALDLKLSTNMSAFGNISGNPVLVIRL